MEGPFSGTVEELCDVDVKELLAHLKATPFEAWPQQKRLADGLVRPAMLAAGEESFPAIAKVMGCFKQCYDRDQMYSAVMPGHGIPSHRDEVTAGWVCRVHVPIVTNPKALVMVAGSKRGLSEHHLKVGKAYAVCVTKLHAIANGGTTPRVHLMFDVVQR